MSSKYAISLTKQQVAKEKSQQLANVLEKYLNGLVERLDAYLDKRLVRTFLQGMRAIIEERNQAPGLTINELGSCVLSGSQAAAGAKRLHRLLTSEKWSDDLIKEFQWEEAQKSVLERQREKEQVFIVWDGSVIEKPESQKNEALCAVKSSKAARRKKSRKGSYNQAGGKPIVVLGMEWSACIALGKKGTPSLAMMEFWSRKGPEATKQKRVEEKMLQRCARQWGKSVLHLFDRGYAGGPWLETLERYDVSFLIRWKKGHHFFDEQGEEKSLGQIGKNKRSWGHRMIWDENKKDYRKTGIVAVPVRHARYARPVWVVIVRRGGEPWYLVTNQCIETEEQAWECYRAYCRRWQVETVFRYEKCELAIETIRLWKPEKRKKLFHMVSLVHSFLLYLVQGEQKDLVQYILCEYCHRTGKKQKEAKFPIYRLRWAISRIWQEIRPSFAFPDSLQAQMASHSGLNVCPQNSG